MAERVIKVKAMGLFLSPDGRFLASPGFDSVKQQSYLRLLGGHVEFGERAAEALAREILEEISAECAVGPLLEVIENSFTHEGDPGQEVVFLFAGFLTDPEIYGRERIPMHEPGKDKVAIWTPVEELLEGRVFCYPPADYATHFARLRRGDVYHPGALPEDKIPL
jgi:ADP-ribose pyrophosphatase YjhB (NUDIX family)